MKTCGFLSLTAGVLLVAAPFAGAHGGGHGWGGGGGWHGGGGWGGGGWGGGWHGGYGHYCGHGDWAWGWGSAWYPYGGWGYGYPYYGTTYYGTDYGASHSTGSFVAKVQERLADAGYFQGVVDGIEGPITRNAIASYQSDHGLAVTGQIDEPLLRSLGLL